MPCSLKSKMLSDDPPNKRIFRVTSIDWNLVGDAIATGKYNLLLGAGVSLDSPSGIPGENCPSAGRLQKLLSDIQPKMRSGSSLSRLYKTLNAKEVDEQITSRFANCAAGETITAISRFRWRRVFTLNVDDALEMAYETASVPTQIAQPVIFIEPYAEIRDLRVLPIVHLHGYARKPEAGYVFDLKEYMRGIRDNNIWAHVLGNLIRSDPFIVMGSSLEEPDISYFLADRAHLSNRPDRPPSIIVEPFPDAGTLADCEEYGMALFEGSALDFLNEIERRFPVRPSVFDAIEENIGDLTKLDVQPLTLAEFHSDFERVPAETLAGNDGGTRFALGHQATWSDIQSGRDVARSETADLQKLIVESTKGTIVIDGLAGSGKTTLLRRISWNLAQAGNLCFWLRSIGRMRIDSAEAVLSRIPGRKFVFVDNFADNVNEVYFLQRKLRDHNVSFVGCERTYRLGHIQRVFAGESLKLFHLGLTGGIADQLVLAYQTYGLATRDQAKDGNGPPISGEVIAVACCRILNNFEPLDAIIDRSMRDASAQDQECYVFAALSTHCYRLGIHYDIISYEFPDYQVDTQTDDVGPLPLKIEKISESEFVLPLNDAVADSTLRRYAERQHDGMQGIFRRLAKAIRPRVSVGAIVQGEPSARIASRLFDYDEVVKPLLGIEGADTFYSATRDEWSWNSRYWHQIAQLSLDKANYADEIDRKIEFAELAVQHVRYAKTIEPHHQFTMTTLGSTLFGKMRVLNKVTPSDLDAAIKALVQAIQIERNRGRVTVHPFMILFKGLNDAFEMDAILSHDQKVAVLSTWSKAQEEFPRDRDLMEQGRRVRASI